MSSTVVHPISRGADTHAALLVSQDRLGTPMDLKLPDGRSIKLELPTTVLCGGTVRLRGHASGGGDLYLEIHLLSYLSVEPPAS